MDNNNIKKYVSENRQWLEELAISGDRVVRAMALAVLKVASDSDSDELDQYEVQ
ncbi:MAG: hypothetical protein PVF58_10360 [Candidatus Methanofastidiosia archaeon]|jgi:hypothetical protein